MLALTLLSYSPSKFKVARFKASCYCKNTVCMHDVVIMRACAQWGYAYV